MNFANIILDQGMSYLFELVYTDSVTGLPKDLTGYNAQLQVRPYAQLPAVIGLTTTDGSIVLGGTSGTIQAYFPPTATANQMWDQAPFDLVLTDTLGIKVKVVAGIVTLVPTQTGVDYMGNPVAI